MNKNKNPNCDNDYCTYKNGEIRVLPLGNSPNHGNILLCKSCFMREIKWRYQRNKELSFECRFDLPKWEDLKVYES